MWSCGSGRRARRADWALRGPRGNPHRGGDVDREVCRLLDIPERTWRGKQARARTVGFSLGPWPRPARDRSRQVVADLARKHPAWGHRKIWAMARHGGHQLTMSTVLRVLRDEGLLLEASYQRERRRLAAERKAASCDPPTGPNQVWQSTSPSMRPAAAALGEPPGSRTTGRSMSSVGIGLRRPTSTTRSPAWS
jgi:hypothetical protein